MNSAISYSGVTVMASTGQYSAQYPHMAHLPMLTWGLSTSFMHAVGHMRTHMPHPTHLSNLSPGRPR